MITKAQFSTSILIIFTLAFGGCGKKITDWARQGEYSFVNNTDYSITYVSGLEKYNIAPKSNITIKRTEEGSETVTAMQYAAPFFADYGFDPVNPQMTIKFGSNKCWTVSIENEHSPLNISNYISERVSERSFRFTYTFTNEDYKRAVDCQ